MNRKLVAVPLAASAFATACSAQANRGAADSVAPTPVVAMPSIDQFASIFDADKGTPRLILPISPT